MFHNKPTTGISPNTFHPVLQTARVRIALSATFSLQTLSNLFTNSSVMFYPSFQALSFKKKRQQSKTVLVAPGVLMFNPGCARLVPKVLKLIRLLKVVNMSLRLPARSAYLSEISVLPRGKIFRQTTTTKSSDTQRK